MKLDPLDYVPRLIALKEKVGLIEAKRQLEREYTLNAIENAGSFYELRALVRALAEKIL